MTLDVTVNDGRTPRTRHLGAERGIGGEGRAPADARAGGRGWKAGRCRAGAATASCARRRPGPPPTRSPPADPSVARGGGLLLVPISATRVRPADGGPRWTRPRGRRARQTTRVWSHVVRRRRAVELPPGARVQACRWRALGAAGEAADRAVHGPAGAQVRLAGSAGGEQAVLTVVARRLAPVLEEMRIPGPRRHRRRRASTRRRAHRHQR